MNAVPDAARKTAPIARDETIAILKPHIGKDLRPIVDQRGLTVWHTIFDEPLLRDSHSFPDSL